MRRIEAQLVGAQRDGIARCRGADHGQRCRASGQGELIAGRDAIAAERTRDIRLDDTRVWRVARAQLATRRHDHGARIEHPRRRRDQRDRLCGFRWRCTRVRTHARRLRGLCPVNDRELPDLANTGDAAIARGKGLHVTDKQRATRCARISRNGKTIVAEYLGVCARGMARARDHRCRQDRQRDAPDRPLKQEQGRKRTSLEASKREPERGAPRRGRFRSIRHRVAHGHTLPLRASASSRIRVHVARSRVAAQTRTARRVNHQSPPSESSAIAIQMGASRTGTSRARGAVSAIHAGSSAAPPRRTREVSASSRPRT